MPAVESTLSLLSLLVEGATLILRDDSPHEPISGSATCTEAPSGLDSAATTTGLQVTIYRVLWDERA